jgi:prepilin-type N-terminal cleavage/methylation domain-containing protein
MGERGVTLVELMVALMLISIALVGLAAAIPAGMFAVSDAGLQVTAIGLAQEPINVAKRTPFSNLTTLVASKAAVSGFSGFQRQVLVTDYVAPADCGGSPCTTSCPVIAGAATCLRIEVRVYYSGNLGDEVSTLVLLRSKD